MPSPSSIESTDSLSSKKIDVEQNRAHDIGRAVAYLRSRVSLSSASASVFPIGRERQASHRRPCDARKSKSCAPITRAVQITIVAPFLSASRHCLASGSSESPMIFSRVLFSIQAARSSEPSARVICRCEESMTVWSRSKIKCIRVSNNSRNV